MKRFLPIHQEFVIVSFRFFPVPLEQLFDEDLILL